MQTFLPYPSFDLSAACLDDKRLGKQRVETMQIMTALVEGRGWVNHPATKMWRCHEYLLLEYQEAVCRQWVSRGFKDTCLSKTTEILFLSDVTAGFTDPLWLGDDAFHRSHQSNLVRKLPEHYRHYFPDVPDNLVYVWPVS